SFLLALGQVEVLHPLAIALVPLGCATRMGEIIGFIFGGAKSLRIDTLGLEATFACFSSLPGTRKSGHLGTDVTTR
ncbi:MAG TPA: hypothetical protein VM715_21665, partial [Candidatus Acidoferrum sp.]|nr:hypothetical protein [Candidatus Acidoferrum sp.]